MRLHVLFTRIECIDYSYNVPYSLDSRKGKKAEKYSRNTFWYDLPGTRKVLKYTNSRAEGPAGDVYGFSPTFTSKVINTKISPKVEKLAVHSVPRRWWCIFLFSLH